MIKQPVNEIKAFETGAKREAKTGKGRYDLLPWSAIHRLAQHYQNGAEIHGDRNWEKGIPLKSFLDSALRHCFQLSAGETDEDHAAAVLWNISGYIWTEDRIKRGLLPASLADGLPFTINIYIYEEINDENIE